MTDRYTQWLIIGALNNSAVVQLAALAVMAAAAALLGPHLWPPGWRSVLVALIGAVGVCIYVAVFALAIIQMAAVMAGGG